LGICWLWCTLHPFQLLLVDPYNFGRAPEPSSWAAVRMFWRTSLEYLYWPKSHINVDWNTLNSSAFYLTDIRARDFPYKKMTTPFRNNARSEECDSSCFRGQATCLFTQHYAY
jgi:hypothetical protein